jgi:DNA replication protein DnaC
MSNQTKLSRISDAIQKSCKSCAGSGCNTCGIQISRIQKYHEANIPASYWNLSFKDFNGDEDFKSIVKSKIEAIDSVFDKGESLLFAGNLGVGKTYAICSILKMALCKDYSAKYYSMAEVINTLLSGGNNSLIKELSELDFLAIDEFDNRWIFPSEKAEQVFGSSMEFLLRNRFQNSLPTFLATNNAEVDQILSGSYARSFSSLRNQFLKTIYVSGKDYRKRNK